MVDDLQSKGATRNDESQDRHEADIEEGGRQEDGQSWRQLDYGASHTSNPTTDRDVPDERDGRGTSRTGFREWEIDSETLETDITDDDDDWNWILYLRRQYDNKWEWYSQLHQGVGEGSRSTDNLDADKLRCVDTLCSTLDCTERTVERVKWLVERMDFNEISRTAPYEATILATITLVANERVDGKHTSRFIRQEDGFDELCESLDVAKREIRTLRGNIRGTDVYTESKHQ